MTAPAIHRYAARGAGNVGPRLLALLLCSTLSLTSCASKSVHHVEHSESVSSGSDAEGSSRGQLRREESSSETTTESKDSSSCSGVLSCGVDAVGAVIAFPFKAVGALISAIF